MLLADPTNRSNSQKQTTEAILLTEASNRSMTVVCVQGSLQPGQLDSWTDSRPVAGHWGAEEERQPEQGAGAQEGQGAGLLHRGQGQPGEGCRRLPGPYTGMPLPLLCNCLSPLSILLLSGCKAFLPKGQRMQHLIVTPKLKSSPAVVLTSAIHTANFRMSASFCSSAYSGFTCHLRVLQCMRL